MSWFDKLTMTMCRNDNKLLNVILRLSKDESKPDAK
jgi:hypothetical protein